MITAGLKKIFVIRKLWGSKKKKKQHKLKKPKSSKLQKNLFKLICAKHQTGSLVH